MRILVRKDAEFVLNTRTITRSPAVDHSSKERGFIETAAEYVMNLLVGMKDIARHLGRSILHGGKIRKERKLIRLVIAVLSDERIRINGRNVDTRGSPGLHPFGGDTHRSELFGQTV